MTLRPDPDGWVARVFLCFAATAGIAYVNIMPALVDALHAGLGYSVARAGQIGSANTYGGALGALTMAMIAPRLPWRSTLVVLSIALIAFDAGCLLVSNVSVMLAARLAHGLFGGAMVGMAYRIIARNHNPSRTFGMLMVLQYGLYMVAMAVLPTLVRRAGIAPLFWLLVGFSAVTLVFVLWLPDYPAQEALAAGPSTATDQSLRRLRLFALAAVWLFQAGNMSVNAFSVSLGRDGGLPLGFVSGSLSVSGLAGLLGGAMTIVLPTRWGLTKPLVASMVLAAGSLAALYHVGDRMVWVVANVINGATWALVLSLLFGMCASFNDSGQSAVWSGFVSKLGLATGPLLGSFILGLASRYQGLIAFASVFICLGLACTWPAARSVDARTVRTVAA